MARPPEAPRPDQTAAAELAAGTTDIKPLSALTPDDVRTIMRLTGATCPLMQNGPSVAKSEGKNPLRLVEAYLDVTGWRFI